MGDEFTGSYTFETATPPEDTGPGAAGYRFADPPDYPAIVDIGAHERGS